MIGSEKLLLAPSVPVAYQQRLLSCNEVHILNMAVAQSWNGETIGVQVHTAPDTAGHNPLYAISDNTAAISKEIKCSGLSHQRAISDSLRMFLERIYKNEADFKTSLYLMTELKCKHNMKKIACLLPPTIHNEPLPGS